MSGMHITNLNILIKARNKKVRLSVFLMVGGPYMLPVHLLPQLILSHTSPSKKLVTGCNMMQIYLKLKI